MQVAYSMFKRQHITIPNMIHDLMTYAYDARSINYPSIITLLCEDAGLQVRLGEPWFPHSKELDDSYKAQVRAIPDQLPPVLDEIYIW